MMEHSIYSVAMPEACASILWRDIARKVEAADALKLTAADLKRLGLPHVSSRRPTSYGGGGAEHGATPVVIRLHVSRNECSPALNGRPRHARVSVPATVAAISAQPSASCPRQCWEEQLSRDNLPRPRVVNQPQAAQAAEIIGVAARGGVEPAPVARQRGTPYGSGGSIHDAGAGPSHARVHLQHTGL